MTDPDDVSHDMEFVQLSHKVQRTEMHIALLYGAIAFLALIVIWQ